ncbi:Coatomer subunit epsilon, putative [Perkinsus marinus ATCC 50983]|uniref:Coatomer subunit epsilon, putative n=1 Tax=Perkinsus marinus (strain ATCC 50983 / TXsc) TaxID=423536 RepID=C5K7H1_PERM5|nr:Coatomer subunit epsilon, putative [Perkinsus marinus ATCC 50983]EER19506.1 Coatomer subunit epsilon, putative [Perkinsus marinus ATCC 50983]|eukprot:XP_002787710.1 Coatomer subunit epsilon, putative [Perkinsus marinus ATCC 50983]
MEDELLEVRDSFYVGAYSRSLQLSEQTAVSSDMVAAEKEALNARCYLAAGMLDHIKGMQHSPNPALKATALMAVFLRTPQENQRKTALDRLQELATTTKDPTALYYYATALSSSGQGAMGAVDAINLTKEYANPEMLAVRAFLAISIDRLDLAERSLKELAKMCAGDESAAAKYANAVCSIMKGDNEEAYLIMTDLGSQYSCDEMSPGGTESVLLTNGKAVANIQRGMYQEAYDDLIRLLQLDQRNADTLVNLACAATHLGKLEEAQKYKETLQQLSHVGCAKAYTSGLQELSNSFSRFQASK